MYLFPFINQCLCCCPSIIQFNHTNKRKWEYLFLFIYFLLLAEECWIFFSCILFFMQSRLVAQLGSLYERHSPSAWGLLISVLIDPSLSHAWKSPQTNRGLATVTRRGRSGKLSSEGNMPRCCAYGLCKSDTRYPKSLDGEVEFFPFPKPKTRLDPRRVSSSLAR